MKSNIRSTPYEEHRLRFFACIAIFALTAVVRWRYIDLYAVALPYWDQWDAEGDEIVRRWILGTLHADFWWDAHNEHRILPGKLVTLLSYVLSGEWSNLREAKLSALVYATIQATLFWAMLRERSTRAAAAALAVVLIANAALPFGWENFLVGLQDVFYFIALFTVLGLLPVASNPRSGNALMLAIVCSIAAVMTLASGLLTPLAIGCVYVVQYVLGRIGPKRLAIALVPLVAISLIAYLTMPVIPEAPQYQARGLVEFLDAANHALAWPLDGYHWAPFYLWLPCAVAAVLFLLRKREPSTFDLVMLGCAAWAIAQALAFAYGRGQSMLLIPSRYTETLALGLAANAWLSVRLVQWAATRRTRLAAYVICICFGSCLLAGHVIRYPGDVRAMEDRHCLSLIQTQNVSAYLKTGDGDRLIQPFQHIPYPDATKLRGFLDDPTLRSVLPPLNENIGQCVLPPR